MATETKELTVLDEFKILEVYKYDVIERAAEAIETEVMSEIVDVTTAKGREREKSLAFKVSGAKSRVVKMGNESIEEAKATVKAVRSEIMRLEDRFNGIRDKRKAASIKWEVADNERRHGHQTEIQKIRDHADPVYMTTAEAIEVKLDSAESFDISGMEEYTPEAELIKAKTIATLEENLKVAMQREDDAAELKKLKEEAAKRKAEDAKREAEDAKRHAEEDRKEHERVEAVLAKEKAEADAKTQAEFEKQRRANEDNRIEQAKQDERAKIEKEHADRLAKEEALRQEANDKAEADRLEKENAELKRQADSTHRNKVREEAINAMLDNGIVIQTREEGVVILAAIEEGEIPHLQINF